MGSIWLDNNRTECRERLKKNLATEVAVVGGGMAGVLTAFQLQKAGKQVVVLEAARIGEGQTENTTAKITSQHGLLYRHLTEKFGKEGARQYGMANEAAIREYQKLIAEENLSCDFEEKNSYIYSQNKEQLKQEAEAAADLGLPAAYVSRVNLPVSSAGAVKFEHQAQFHPLKFLYQIASDLTIYENTAVRAVNEHTLKTDSGDVEAEQIVFACHYPFINFPGLYFARMHQERSYVLALENAAQVNGMYLGVGNNAYSFRNYGDLLLFGGENHRTGENSKGGRYDALRKKAAELYPDSREVACWSAQDCMTADQVPYIGPYASAQPNWYVATGFRKWGMSSSMAAAMILTDLLCKRENPYAKIFDPGRVPSEAIPKIACEGGQAVKGLAKRFFQLPAETARELPVGHGGIVRLGDKKLGVYKDKKNELFVVDVRCPHLGCQLEWNPDELSWDCPCHGSRFDYHGKLLCDPAQEDIAHE